MFDAKFIIFNLIKSWNKGKGHKARAINGSDYFTKNKVIFSHE